MHLSSLVPALCCTVSLILAFLCLFAGHKQSFMEDYHLVTLNTSLLGETLLPTNRDTSSDNPLENLLNSIPNEISDSINDRIGEVTAKLGIEDWYSAHLLDYCYGQYTPVEVANASIPHSSISKNVTGCSKTQAMYRFDPTQILNDALSKAGVDITLQDLKWPDDIQNGIDALNALMGAMFVLYILSIVLIFIALLTSLFTTFTHPGRGTFCINLLSAILAFLAIGIASALVTAVMIKASEIVNKYGNEIGVEAYYGSKFLGLTWAATGVMVGPLVTWGIEVCCGRSRRREVRYGGKKGDL